MYARTRAGVAAALQISSTYMGAYTHAYIYFTYMYIRTRAYAPMYARTSAGVAAALQISSTYMGAYTHACIFLHICIYSHVHMNTCTREPAPE